MERMTEKATKNPVISIIRLLALCLIVFSHICQRYGNEMAWWLNSGVQLFLIISGFLYGQKKHIETKTFIRKRLMRILGDYYVYLIIIIPIYIFVYKYFFSANEIIKLMFGLGTNIPGLGHLWFISTIIICYLLTPIVYKIQHAERVMFKYVLLFLAIEGICAIIPGITGAWINCYIIGLLIGNVTLTSKKSDIQLYKQGLSVCIPFMILLNGIEILAKYVIKLQLNSFVGKVANTVYHYGHIALALCVFFCIMILLYDRDTTKMETMIRSKLLVLSDKYSYNIYIVHLFFILGPLSLFRENATIISLLLSFAFFVVLTIICAVILAGITRSIFQAINKYRNNSCS